MRKLAEKLKELADVLFLRAATMAISAASNAFPS
jgi:hypothetical protein